MCFDILVRWLEASGLQVTYCRNVTDIDDKILAAAAAEGMPWWALAERNQRAFASGYALLGCRPPDVGAAGYRAHPRHGGAHRAAAGERARLPGRAATCAST